MLALWNHLGVNPTHAMPGDFLAGVFLDEVACVGVSRPPDGRYAESRVSYAEEGHQRFGLDIG